MQTLDPLITKLHGCWVRSGGQFKVTFKQIANLKEVQVFKDKFILVFKHTTYSVPIPYGLLGNSRRKLPYTRSKMHFISTLPLLQQTPEVKALSALLSKAYLEIRK